MSETLALPQSELELRTMMAKVYQWMSAGLAVTGGVAWYMASHEGMIRNLVRSPILFFGLLAVELGAVFWLSGWVHRMSSSTASLVFLSYAALNGVTMSVIFLVYTRSSIANAFFVTAGTFGVMSLYGYTTKTDLTTVGNICFMGLVGILIASFANFWFRSPALYWITTYAGVLVFTGLTAYDTQKIKGMLNPADEGTDAETLDAISGALALYLDFINLFLDILRIMGKRRD
jgi:hypothetical protein